MGEKIENGGVVKKIILDYVINNPTVILSEESHFNWLYNTLYNLFMYDYSLYGYNATGVLDDYLDFNIIDKDNKIKIIPNNIVCGLWLCDKMMNNPDDVFENNEFIFDGYRYTFKKNKIIKEKL